MRNLRVNFIFSLIIILGAAIISRLFYIQIINHKFYQAQALGQQAIMEEIQGARGEIFSKDGQKSLSINEDKWSLYITSDEIEDKDKLASQISEIIKNPAKDIISKIDNGDPYVLIENKLTQEQADAITSLKLKGITLEKQAARYYPQKETAAQLLGFVGGDETGQYGLEGYYDSILKGEKTFKEESRSSIFFNPDQLEPNSFDGSDLYLTIDYNIQFEVESLLKQAKKDFNIEAGQIIVMDPQTGQILALANYPNFDLNKYSKEKDLDIFQDAAVQKLYELGSVLKPITMAIAINEGKVTPETTYVDEGCVKVGVETLCNFDHVKYGKQTMTGVLENSINTGAVFVSKLIPHDMYLDYIDKFGLGEKTGIDLQGEVFSRNNNLRNGQDINFATASFGQGIELTPIQFIRAFAVIANGGKLVKPYIVGKIINNQKQTLETQPKVIRQVINQSTATQLTTMLISTVERGVASKAKVPGYYVAGKTGTAQVAYPDKPGYYPDKTTHTFAGFAPALNPRFVALIKLDNPKGRISGITAAPLFSKLAQYILNYWQIPPDYQ